MVKHPRPDLFEKSVKAFEQMRQCRFCAFQCGVNRFEETGQCGHGVEAGIFLAQMLSAGEAELTPSFGIRLSGCNLNCGFCVTGETNFKETASTPIDYDSLQAQIQTALTSARSVMILGGEPTAHLDAALKIAASIPASVPLVWKTNAYFPVNTLDWLDGGIDIFLPDFKFGNDACAQRIARAPRYFEMVSSVLKTAHGRFKTIVRHLLLPSHFECCFLPILDWLAAEMPEVPLSLMDGFLPVYHSDQYPELRRILRPEESSRALEAAMSRGLKLVPWTLNGGATSIKNNSLNMKETPAAERLKGQEEIWIDRDGRVCVRSASPELAFQLNRILNDAMRRE